MKAYLLSVIIAAKDPPETQFVRCLASFSALAQVHRIQLVLVESGEPLLVTAESVSQFANVKRLRVPAEGVYSAYNAGIDVAEGTYLLFFGADDIALPGMDSVIEHLDATAAAYHLYAATCYMQASGLLNPSARRLSLIRANWCHQGIFYLRDYLSNHRYEARYQMQADHKLNIDIVSNKQLRFGVSQTTVAYFSAGGISSMSPDLVFRKDFPSIVAVAYGQPWGWLVRVKQILVDFLVGPPEKRFVPHDK